MSRQSDAITRRGEAWWYRITAPVRPLPDLLIIGAMKGGTSSLYSHLLRSEAVQPARGRKEVRYFGDHHDRSLNWYRSHFQRRRPGRLIAEAAAGYLSHPDAPERARSTVPNVKMVALLRDPVERAYSHYRHQVRRKRETLSFEDALAQESERISPLDWDTAQSPTNLFCYRERGHYAMQLREWHRSFPADAILTVQSEQFFRSPAETTAMVLAWLGVVSTPPNDLAVQNAAPAGPGMSDTARRELRSYFAPLNEELFDLLGQRYDWPC